MMFQGPAAELFDRSCAIIHWEIPHAVLVRSNQILIVPHLLAIALSWPYFSKILQELWLSIHSLEHFQRSLGTLPILCHCKSSLLIVYFSY